MPVCCPPSPAPFAEAPGVIVGRSPTRRPRRRFICPPARAAACCGWIGRGRKQSGCAEGDRLSIACKAARFWQRFWQQRWLSNSSSLRRRPVRRVNIRRISVPFGYHKDIQSIFFGWLSTIDHINRPPYPEASISIGRHIHRLPYP